MSCLSHYWPLRKMEMHSFTSKFQTLSGVRDTAPIAETGEAVFFYEVSQIRGKGVINRSVGV
jgi:hypothetical protein